MAAKVTIIVPIYNVEKYVRKCLTSLINQTYRDIEIWAVDDGSPDNSKEIVKELSGEDSRIKLIKKENGGYGSVLEYSIQHIKSEYFLICDPDDWLTDDAIQKLYGLAQRDDLDMVIGDRINIYGSTNEEVYVKVPENKYYKINPNMVYTKKNDIQKFAFSQPSPHAKLYRTQIARNIKFPKKVSYTDFVLYILSLADAKRIEYLPEALSYYYFDRPGNTATDLKATIINDYLVVWNSIFKQLQKKSGVDILYYRLYEQLKYSLYKYALSAPQPFDDEYTNQIFDAIVNLQNYRKNIKKVAVGSIRDKIVLDGFMNKHAYKIMAKKLVNKYNRQ